MVIFVKTPHSFLNSSPISYLSKENAPWWSTELMAAFPPASSLKTQCRGASLNCHLWADSIPVPSPPGHCCIRGLGTWLCHHLFKSPPVVMCGLRKGPMSSFTNTLLLPHTTPGVQPQDRISKEQWGRGQTSDSGPHDKRYGVCILNQQFPNQQDSVQDSVLQW